MDGISDSKHYKLVAETVHCNESTGRNLGGNSSLEACLTTHPCVCSINLLKPTGYVMHHQFNIPQLYALPTLYLCVLYLSQNKQ